MNNPTDTNQASEDELEQKVEIIVLAGWRYGKQKEEVLNLIRTEKLKLLAEVRERVVGEDEVEDIDLSKSAKSRWGVRARNRVRDDSRTALDKLEAEL